MKAWDDTWATSEGRADWLVPEPWVEQQIASFRDHGAETCLDLGCGLGRHALIASELGMQVAAVDSSPNGLAFARRAAHVRKLPIDLALADMRALPFVTGAFDLIVSWNVLYHGLLPDVQGALAEVRRCLQVGGWLLCTFISTRNRQFGIGEEIAPGTWVDSRSPEKAHPHHYVDLIAIQDLLRGFDLIHCEEIDTDCAGNEHWWVLARLSDSAFT